jgi:hypothetical protein
MKDRPEIPAQTFDVRPATLRLLASLTSTTSLREVARKSTTTCSPPTYANPLLRFPPKNQKREALPRLTPGFRLSPFRFRPSEPSTSDFRPSRLFRFHHFPLGSEPKIPKRLPAANLRQSASPLPTEKSEKGSASDARSQPSAFGFPRTFDLDLVRIPAPFPAPDHDLD